MKIGYSPESIVGLDGMPLVGRVTLYVHDRDVKKDVFTLQGDNFVQAANPQLLDNAGRIAETLFFDAAIVDVLVEKYVGADGQMSVLSPDTDFESFDRFEIGFDPMNVEGSDKVGTIADLMDTDTSKGSVTVIGYYSAGDCAPRTYVWDRDSQDDIDGGYVVGSNIDDTGRWILLWNDEVIPSSVYGIIPGTNEANINAFLNYTATVGSFLEHTAPIARFESGTYSSDVTFITTKEVAFDGKAKFIYANFQLPKMKVFGNNTDYIADFVLGSNFSGAHSSWFRTADSFWKCGAGKLVIDNTNYFTSTLLTSSVTVNGIIEGSRPLGTTYSTGAYIGIGATCETVGRIFRPNSDYIRFTTAGHGDKSFITLGTFDPGLISDGHKVQYDYVPDLDMFEDASRYANVMVEMKSRLGSSMTDVLDMQGRCMTGINTGIFGVVRNVQCTDMSVHAPNRVVEIHNVKTTNFNPVCQALYVYDSDINFGHLPQQNTYSYYSNCRLSASFAFNDPNMRCEFENCLIDMSFDRVTDNIALDAALIFNGCVFTANQRIYTKNLEMYRCKTARTDIKVYPHNDGNDYRLNVVLENNLFDNDEPIDFTKMDIVGGSRDEDCYDCILTWKIVGNTFLGNSDGIKMRYWQFRAGNYPNRTFFKGDDVHSITYKGNHGNCPSEDMRGVVISDNTAYTQVDVGGNELCLYEGFTKRCMPKVTSSVWYLVGTYGFEQMFKYYSAVTVPYDSLTYDMFVEHPLWCFEDYMEQTYDGDFFKLAPGLLNDYIRIVQSGGNDHNSNVTAVVV